MYILILVRRRRRKWIFLCWYLKLKCIQTCNFRACGAFKGGPPTYTEFQKKMRIFFWDRKFYFSNRSKNSFISLLEHLCFFWNFIFSPTSVYAGGPPLTPPDGEIWSIGTFFFGKKLKNWKFKRFWPVKAVFRIFWHWKNLN